MKQHPLYNVRYRMIENPPQSLWCGEAVLLRIELTNTGIVPWLTFGSHPVRLAYHWCTAQGHMVVQDGRRTLLPTSVPPDTRVILELRAESPPDPGEYELVIDLVEEGIGWFAERGVEPLVIPLSYQRSNAPRACIINGNCVINDAVGNHVVAQLQVLRHAGYHTLLLVEHVDERLPTDIRRSAVALRLADFQSPDESIQYAITHFFASDIVIVTYSTYYELAQTIKLARHSSIIFDYHGVTPPEHWDSQAPGYMDLVLGQQHTTLVQYADYAMVRSHFMANELLHTGLIPARRVSVTPLGTVAPLPTHTSVTAATLVERYSLHGKYVLLYVGRMARNKRVRDLVEALVHVHQYYPETVLLLVGENQFGPYRDYAAEVVKRAEELGCQEQVIFTGQVPNLEPYYQVCHLFVTASVHEGFGMPVIEAMAHGKPVVAAAAAALIETVGSGGLLFEPENPVDLAHKIVDLFNAMPPQPETVPALPAAARRTTPTAKDEWPDIRTKVIAFVTPRYGTEIVGGAERLIRGWAEHLSSQGYQVEVLTTCTADMGDWSNHYAPGVAQINGVTVRRFGVDPVDNSVFHRIQAKAKQNEKITYSDECEFMRQNFQSSALNTYLHTHAADFVCVIFAPYLFGTTYWGMQAVPEKAIIVPCLHDEPAAYFSIIREMLEGAAGIFFNTQAECDFATSTLGVVNPARFVVGYGFDWPPVYGDADRFRSRYNLPEVFLLYSGRLEEGKNVPLLWDYFMRYKQEHPGRLALVLTGAKSIPVPEHPDIFALGILPEEEMPDAFAAAYALCQPSLNESFSIVLMESWLQGRPVLVHADCAVTNMHVAQSGGGLTFDTYTSFCAALDQLLQHSEQAQAMGQRGHAYVQQSYAWDVIRNQILHGIAAFTQEQTSYTRLVQQGIQRSLAFTHDRFADAMLRVVEQARAIVPWPIQDQQHQLDQMARVAMPDYTIQSRLPLVGRLVAWTRKQITSHLKEPYLDPIIERQAAFNQQLLQTVFSLLEQSIYEQRQLRRELDILHEHVAQNKQIKQELNMLWQFAHGHPHNDDLFLEAAYQFVLKRTPDAADYAYYAQALQSNKLTKRAIVDAFMQSDEYKYELYTLPIQPPDALHRARLMLFQQCLPPAQNIVDLGGAAHGCQEGSLLAMGYPHHAQEITIIDLPPPDRIGGIAMSESPQDIVTEKGVHVRYLYSSMTDLSPVADQSIDLVASGESIEHITEADADIVCREAYRVLKPGGYFCLDTPNAALTRLQSPHELPHPEHKKEYYVHELQAKLEQSGFVIVEAKGICPMPESLRKQLFDYRELVQNIALTDTPEEGYLFFLKAIKPQESS